MDKSTSRPMRILTSIALGTQIATLVVMVIVTVFQNNLVRMFGLADVWGGTVILWNSFIPGVTFGILVLVMFILVRVKRGNGLRISGIVIAAVATLNQIVNLAVVYFGNLFLSSFYGHYGALALAKNSALTSAYSLFNSPFATITTACLYIVCGMCICTRTESGAQNRI